MSKTVQANTSKAATKQDLVAGTAIAQAAEPAVRPGLMLAPGQLGDMIDTAGLAVFCTCEAGGVRKTSTALAAEHVLTRRKLTVSFVELDEKASAVNLLEGAEYIAMPSAADLRENDLAVAKRLGGLRARLLSLEPGQVFIADTGANQDASVCDWAYRVHLGKRLQARGVGVVVMIPVGTGPGQAAAAARTRERMETAFPDAFFVPVLLGSESALDGLSGRDEAGAAAFRHEIAAGIVVMHQTLPRAAAVALGRLGRPLGPLAETGALEAEAWPGLSEGENCYIHSDFEEAWSDLETSLSRLFFRGAGA